MKRIYLAGPMTGLPDFNRPAFNAAAARLRAAGFEVENPAEIAPPVCGTWAGYMRVSIPLMLVCDTVVLLHGWEKSRGAKIERQLAHDLGINIVGFGGLSQGVLMGVKAE